MIQTPLPPDYEIGNAAKEAEAQGLSTDLRLTDALIDLVTHACSSTGSNIHQTDEHVRVVLEWAFQIAFLERLPLGIATSVAITFYYG